MIALLAAASVAASTPPATERTPNFYQTPEACRFAPYHVVDRYGRPLPDRLGDLPQGALLLAVERRVNGCPVITLMRADARPDPRAQPAAPR